MSYMNKSRVKKAFFTSDFNFYLVGQADNYGAHDHSTIQVITMKSMLPGLCEPWSQITPIGKGLAG